MAEETVVATQVESQPTTLHVEEMNDTQREKWLRTGEHPEIKPKTAEPAPAPAKKEASQATEEQKPKKTAADRVQELLQERHELRQELEKLKTAPKAEPQTAKQPAQSEATEPKPPEKPKHPDIAQFKTTAEYDLAMDKYDQAMETYSAQKQAFEDAKKQSEENQKKLETKLTEGWERVQSKYQDAKEKSAPIFTALLENSRAMPEVTWFLNTTEVLPDMLYVLGGKFKLDEFIELGKTNSAKAIRLLATMEEEIIKEIAKPAEKEEEPAPREPKKKVTEAPAPPREIGGKASVTEDPLKTAVARRDFDSFQQNANARDIQRRQRGR